MSRVQKSLIILSVAIVLLFGIVIYRQLPVGDYQHHLDWAKELAETGYIYRPPNNLFQNLVVITRPLLPFRIFTIISPYFKTIIDKRSYDMVALLLMVAALIGTALIIYKRLKDIQEEVEKKTVSWWLIGFTLLPMLVGPIFFFTMPERTYLGYITGNVYHNPTVILLRPLAIAVFFLGFQQLYARPAWKPILLGGVLLALATQAKPNFTLTFLPAIALFALFDLKRFRSINWWYIFVGLALPAAAILAEQYYMTYTGSNGDSIIFAPFQAILQYVPNIGTELLFILLSILFPLAFTILYRQQLRKEKTILLAWLNFLVGLAIALLFTEVEEQHALNFWWGPMVGLYILFIETIGQSLKLGVFNFRNKDNLVIKLSLTGILLLHLVCGGIYYVTVIRTPAPILLPG